MSHFIRSVLYCFLVTVVAAQCLTTNLGNRSTDVFCTVTYKREVKGKPFPRLIDVDLEELVTALESGLFSSVELTTVCLLHELSDASR